MECAMNVNPSPLDLTLSRLAARPCDFVTEPPYSLVACGPGMKGGSAMKVDDVILAVLHDPMSYELDIALSRALCRAGGPASVHAC